MRTFTWKNFNVEKSSVHLFHSKARKSSLCLRSSGKSVLLYGAPVWGLGPPSWACPVLLWLKLLPAVIYHYEEYAIHYYYKKWTVKNFLRCLRHFLLIRGTAKHGTMTCLSGRNPALPWTMLHLNRCFKNRLGRVADPIQPYLGHFQLFQIVTVHQLYN